MASAGDLWLVDFAEPYPGEPAHHRPALVLGPPIAFGADFPFVVVCPLTTTRRGLSLHVGIEADDRTGLEQRSYVQCELLRSIDRRRLVHRVGLIDDTVSGHVRDIVATMLDL